MFRIILVTLMTVVFATAGFAQNSGYKIKAGDQLGIEVLEDPSLNRSILVLPDGNISFPLAGSLRAAGLTVGQLKGALTNGLAPNFASTPSVFVSVQSVSAPVAAKSSGRSTFEVFLIGEVEQPGAHKVTRGTTVLQFLAQSGGFTRFAAKKRLQLRRTNSDGSSKTFKINYKAIEEGKDVATGMARLQSGDVIVVPERKLFE